MTFPEDTWGKVFRAEGKQYRQPKLVLFRDGVASACGYSEAAVGPSTQMLRTLSRPVLGV